MNRFHPGPSASRPCPRNGECAARCDRRPHRHSAVRQGLALSRLTALIALGFMSALPAAGASFNDLIGFSAADQRLLPAPSAVTDLILSGDYGPGAQLVVDGVGSLARVPRYAALRGASLVNSGGGKTLVAGTFELIDRGSRLVVGSGSELVLERSGSLSTYDGTVDILSGGLLSNRGQIRLSRDSLFNRGVIDNAGYFYVAEGSRLFGTGVFNNLAGGEVSVDGSLDLGGFTGGRLNLQAGSTLNVNGFVVAEGHRQVNAGTINVRGGFGSASVLGELQIGDGGSSGTVNTGREQIRAELATSVISFDRSDDNHFTGGIAGAGQLVKRNGNQLTLDGYNTYTGRTLVEGGRLVLQTNVASTAFHIAAGATLELDAGTRVDDLELHGRFSGGGQLVKSGTLRLALDPGRTVLALDAGARIEVLQGSFAMRKFSGEWTSADWSQNRSGLLVAGAAVFSGGRDNVRVDALSGGGLIQSGHSGTAYEGFRFGVAGGSGSFSGVLADTDAANRHIGSFIKEGSGTQVLTGNNTFTGGLAILEGQVHIGDGGTSGSLAVRQIFNQTELSFSRSDDSRFDGTIVGTGNLTKLGAGQLTLTQSQPTLSPGYSGLTSVRGGTLVLSNLNHSRGHDISQGAVLALQVASGNRDGTVATQFTGQGTLRKTGTGQSLWGASAATFAMAAGSLIDVQAGSFVGGSYANEDWRLNQSALHVAADASFYGVEANVRVDGLSGAGRITSGYASAGYTAFTLGVANGSGDFAGVLADSSAGNAGHFVKVGSGTQTLSGTNTYVGGTTLAGGVLSVARDANLGGKPVVFGDFGGLIFQGGTLRNTGAFITTRPVTLGEGGGGFDTAGGYLTINSNVGGAGGLVKTGGDILTLAGAQGYTGATVISAGTLKFSALGATASSVASASIAIASGARLIFADSQTYAGAITGAGLLMHEFGGTTTLTGHATHSGGTLIAGGTLQVGNGGTSGLLAGDVVDNGLLVFKRSDDLVFAGSISGSGGVQQRGSGTLTLIGANTYRGATTVSAGAIQLNGSALNSAFSVGAGATLGGNAQVGTLVVAGTLTPGNSPGQMSAGATTFASGGQYLWEINDGTGLAGIGHDLLNVAGTLSIDASPGSRFTVSLRSLLGDNSPGDVAHFDATVDHQFTLVRTSGGILGFSADEFAIDSSGFGNATFGGQWAVAVTGRGQGQDLTLNFTAAVPEPGTYALMLAGLLGVGVAARRRRSTGTANRG